MSHEQRWSVAWVSPDGRLEAIEPSRPEVEAAAPRLSAWYNEPHNRAMMSNETEMAPDEVVRHFEDVAQKGSRNFLKRFFGHQERPYGTRFALMLHAFAFETLRLEHVYVSIIPQNSGSLRLFEKLGYQSDDSPAARAYIDEPDDVTLSFARADFLRLHSATVQKLTYRSA